MTFEYFLVCESVNVDAATNMVSLFNVIDQLATARVPMVIPRITIIGCWRVEPNDHLDNYQAVFRVTPPGPPPQGNPGFRDFRTNLELDRRRVRVIYTVLNIPIENPGDLLVEVSLNGQHQASHLINIEMAPVGDSGENFNQ